MMTMTMEMKMMMDIYEDQKGLGCMPNSENDISLISYFILKSSKHL